MMIYSCFPPLDQAQNGLVCVFLGCLAEPREKTGKERDREEKREKRRVRCWEKKGNRKRIWEMGNNERKTKEINELV